VYQKDQILSWMTANRLAPLIAGENSGSGVELVLDTSQIRSAACVAVNQH
jgi:hypothetical protein